jgi:CRISPR-associated protein (TIGR03986 family)
VTGRIKNICPDKNFGFITTAAGDVYFSISKFKIPEEQLAKGQTVELEYQETSRGKSATRLKIIGTSLQPRRSNAANSAHTAGNSQEHGYRFYNPYNFVRYLVQPTPGGRASADSELGEMAAELPETARDANIKLLGKCPPPGHDRFVGLSGRIECVATGVTPLFISDAHGIEVGDNGHRSYRFFQYNGQKALPASSLRGMVRSVFEAATNSCFSTIEERRLFYRFPSEAAELVPGRVEKDDDDRLVLRLLPGVTEINFNGRPAGELYGAWVPRYGNKSVDIPLGYQEGEPLYALLQSTVHGKPTFKYWQVLELSVEEALMRQKLEHEKSAGLRVARGWLYITKRNIGNKHDERFFFRSRDANQKLQETIAIPEPVIRDWENLISDYRERLGDEIKRRRGDHKDPASFYGPKEPAFSSYIISDGKKSDCKRLAEGDLVYARLRPPAQCPVIEWLAPAAVPRRAYRDSILDLLPAHLRPCNRYEELCPACRMFGWVRNPEYGADDRKSQDAPEIAEQRGGPVAYRSRLRFQNGSLIAEQGSMRRSLSILSSPKPTTARFYLMDKNRQTLDGADESDCVYDQARNLLRGRKFYLHHGNLDNESEENFRKNPERNNNDQNRTVLDALKPGCKFKFAIEFDNLAPLELGALLWSLELDGCYHRLGYAKPLGFGSIGVEVCGHDDEKKSGVFVLDPVARYTAIEETGIRRVDCCVWRKWAELFKESLAQKYGPGKSFDELDNIQDLRAILSKAPHNLPVHYPRPSREVREEGANFEWFLGNKRGPKKALDFPGGKALPIIDRNGNEI